MDRQSEFPSHFGPRRGFASVGSAPQNPRQDQNDPLEQMREQFERDRDSFFDQPRIHQREPFFRQHPGFDNFPGPPGPNFPSNMGGFPDSADRPDEAGGGIGGGGFMFPHHQRGGHGGHSGHGDSDHHESIPIRVIHEKTPKKHHAASASRNTTELPAKASAPAAAASPESPRLERAHSEPPKAFNQRLFQSRQPHGAAAGHYSAIPENSPAPASPAPAPHQSAAAGGGLEVPSGQHNLSTSASAPSVPDSNSGTAGPPVPPQRRFSPTKRAEKFGQAPSDADHVRKQSAPVPGAAVRHIPIHIEGRDDPQQQQPPPPPPQRGADFRKPSDYYPVGARKANAQAPSHPAEPTSPISPPPGPIPMGWNPTLLNNQSQAQPPQTGEPTSPLPAPEGPIPLPCSPDLYGQTDAAEAKAKAEEATAATPSNAQPEQQPPQQQQEPLQGPNSQEAQPQQQGPIEVKVNVVDGGATGTPPPPPPPPQPATAPPQPASTPSGPEGVALTKMQKVKDDVSSLMQKIDSFKGKKTDKEYLYLDEMLTRNLLMLDGVDTCGKDDLRQLRKDSIRSINRCLSMLDTKAKASDAEDNNQVLAELAKESHEDSQTSGSDGAGTGDDKDKPKEK